MKFSIIGDMHEDTTLSFIDVFVQDHTVGKPVIISAGSINTMHFVDKWAKGKGYDSIILGNTYNLAVLNADRIIFVWDGVDKKYQEAVDLCRKEKKAYTEIKTK